MKRDGQLCCVLLLGSNVRVPVRLRAAVGHDVAEHVETSDATTLDATALAHRDALAQLLLGGFVWIPCSVEAPS